MKTISTHNFQFVEQKNDYWISGIEICRNLGYAQPGTQANIIWSRNKEDLHEDSCTIKMMVQGNNQKRIIRVYNEAGARFFISQCKIDSAKKITMQMIKAFIQLRDMHQEQLRYREQGKLIYRGLTDQLQLIEEGEPEEKNQFLYINMAKLNCKAVTGLTPRELRVERGVKNTRDGLRPEELVRIAALELFQTEYLKQLPNQDRKEAHQGAKALSKKFMYWSKPEFLQQYKIEN